MASISQQPALRVRWPRRDRLLMEGAVVEVAALRGAIVHVSACHHARAGGRQHAIITDEAPTDGSLCSRCMRLLLPGVTVRAAAAARPAWQGIGDATKAPLLAKVGLTHALELVSAMVVALDEAGAEVATKRFEHIDGELRDLLTNVEVAASGSAWASSVEAAVGARLLAAWCAGRTAGTPPAALAVLDDILPAKDKSPALAVHLHAISDQLLIGEPSSELIELLNVLMGHQTHLRHTGEPATSSDADQFDALTRWALIAEAEHALEELRLRRSDLDAALDGQRTELHKDTPTRKASGDRLLLGARPDWLWQAVLAGLVADSEAVDGNGRDRDAARVSPMVRLALVNTTAKAPRDAD